MISHSHTQLSPVPPLLRAYLASLKPLSSLLATGLFPNWLTVPAKNPSPGLFCNLPEPTRDLIFFPSCLSNISGVSFYYYPICAGIRNASQLRQENVINKLFTSPSRSLINMLNETATLPSDAKTRWDTKLAFLTLYCLHPMLVPVRLLQSKFPSKPADELKFISPKRDICSPLPIRFCEPGDETPELMPEGGTVGWITLVWHRTCVSLQNSFPLHGVPLWHPIHGTSKYHQSLVLFLNNLCPKLYYR